MLKAKAPAEAEDGKPRQKVLWNTQLPWKNHEVVCGGKFPASAYCFCLNLFHVVHPRAFVGRQGTGDWWCPKLWHLPVGEREKPYSSKQPNQLVQSPLKPWGRFVNVVVVESRSHWCLTEINPRITTVPLKIPLLTLKHLGYGSAASALAKMMVVKSQEALHESEESQIFSVDLASEGSKGDV